MSMVDRQRYRQHSYFDGESSVGDHSSSVSAQDVGESQVRRQGYDSQSDVR